MCDSGAQGGRRMGAEMARSIGRQAQRAAEQQSAIDPKDDV
jgi:hypothetical protein